jgi:hypothetical protein
MQRHRATFTAAWESLPSGIEEGTTFAMGAMRVTVTTCPTQQKWFGLFLRGAESRMGYTSQQNQPLRVGVVAKMLEMVLEEVMDQEIHIAKEFIKFGAAAALAVCASLQGNEVFLLDLAGMRRYIKLGRDREVLQDPMKIGIDLSRAPHVMCVCVSYPPATAVVF